jgi:anti-anti-sigma regulatory factor
MGQFQTIKIQRFDAQMVITPTEKNFTDSNEEWINQFGDDMRAVLSENPDVHIFILDLDNVEVIEHLGIAEILLLTLSIEHVGHHFVLCNISDQAMRDSQIYKFEDELFIAEDIEAIKEISFQ